MGYIELPVITGNTNHEFKAELSGKVYLFHFRWNTRAACWIMSISTENEGPIISGMSIALGTDLLAQYKDSRLPGGSLFAINYANEYQEPDRDNLGTDVAIVYKETE